jgi:hypothetical protein
MTIAVIAPVRAVAVTAATVSPNTWSLNMMSHFARYAGNQPTLTCQNAQAVGRSTKRRTEMFYLWYDNGSDYFDCASSHTTLDEAIRAAGSGWQTRQYITNDSDGKNIVWKNYKERRK